MELLIPTRWHIDCYKFSMGNVFNQRFSNLEARYIFVDRNNLVMPEGLGDELRRQVECMQYLPPNAEVGTYMKEQWPFVPGDYFDWYTYKFRFNPDHVQISQKNGKLSVAITGPLVEVTYWELPLLRMISILYNKLTGRVAQPGYVERASEKAEFFFEHDVAYSTMAGRRPFSAEVHRECLAACLPYVQQGKHQPGLIGCSWAQYAYDFGLKPMGTVAHEYYQIIGAIYGIEVANKIAMMIWHEIYGKSLGYVLTDTFTTDYFLKDFDRIFAMIFEGLRQDSGDPIAFVTKVLAHLHNIGIVANEKTIIHTNSLRDKSEIRLNGHFCW